jgi:hypothetical protein
MLDRTETSLNIIANFHPDRSLPKYVKIDEEEKKKRKERNSKFEVLSNDMVEFEVSGSNPVIMREYIQPRGFWGRILGWILSWLRKPPVIIKRMSIVEFFSSVKSSAQDISIIEARAEGYKRAIIKAKQSGQTALLEKLTDGLHAYKMETQMLSIGIDKFVSEATIVEFYKKCPKGLRLDYVKNFARPIPDNLVEIKVQADELELFDNYAILSYDPEAKSYEETKREQAARKDPILFGVLKGRSDLYVIGDWVDDMCDLTLDGMAEVLGRAATEEFEQLEPNDA